LNQVVVVSPLTRTLETAAGIFGEENFDAESLSPESILMRASTAVEKEVSAHKKIALPQLPFVASELCRERICRLLSLPNTSLLTGFVRGLVRKYSVGWRDS